MKRLVCALISSLVILCGMQIFALSESEKPKVVAFGDSITAADKWQKYIEQEYGIDIINRGVGGDSTHTAMARFRQEVIYSSADIVFISLGTNDAAIDMEKHTPLEEYKENLRRFIDQCKNAGVKVILNIPTPIVDEPYLTRHDPEPFLEYGGPNGLLALYAQAAREVAVEKNVVYADINAAFLATDDYTKYFPDGIHPNDAGYKIYAECVLSVYERLWIGDINGDGNVNQYDYILARRAYFETIVLDEKQKTRADVNCDGKNDQYDYVLIKRAYFGTYTLLGN
ncbi:MAG: hypothetical protein IJY88_07945 [Clostridia bacterium]|nr:hypothetical protein [Clostridia bacterium]